MQSSEIWRLEQVGSVIRKGKLGQFGHLEYTGDTDWIKGCTKMKIEGIRQDRDI